MRRRPLLIAHGHRRPWVVAVALAALGLLAVTGWRLAASQAAFGRYKGFAVTPPKPAPELQLADENGRPFRFADLRGRAVLLFFGYTFCPDVCPTTLAEFREVRARLGTMADRVAFVFVTVDPERDSPERLRSYLRAFGAPIKGLTGDPEALAALRRHYGVYAAREPAPGSTVGYLMAHSAYTYLLDPLGRLRFTYPYGTPPADMAHDLR
ncbi:MAG: SCO family protein, partial [Clostridia bacterium]|nr:SCO family protein [Clostridia bacterium]